MPVEFVFSEDRQVEISNRIQRRNEWSAEILSTRECDNLVRTVREWLGARVATECFQRPSLCRHKNCLMTEALNDESLRMIVESLPTGTIIVNQSGQIVMLNRQVEEWFGYGREELLGLTVECLIPERFLPQHLQSRDEYFTAPCVRPMGGNRELFAKRKDGSEFPCDISLYPLPLITGMHVMVHMVDATHRHQQEARQRHQESLKRMQFMVENLPAGAVYVSLDTESLLVNRAFTEMTGYQDHEFRDLSHAYQLLFQERAAEVRQLHDEDQVEGFPVPRVLLVNRKDGKQAWVEVAAYRYGSHEVWLWHDITESLATQERLLQSTRLAAIGEMMTGLAHESRNALQRAQAALDMLELELDLEHRPELRTLSRRAISAIDELQRLYEEVRNYAAPIQLEWREMDLAQVCQEVWPQVQQVYRDKHITFAATPMEESSHVRIDRYRIQQVFRNILENAVAVLPDHGGKIEVTSALVEVDGRSWIEVAIQDNGPGMSDEQRSRIFEPFYTTKTRGTGLGMAIVRRIMDAHGGSATVGSPERGARIILRFPKT